MTISQDILWTALPNGLATDGRLKLSALVSPRLRSNAPDPRLGPDFVDFLDWPTVINAVTFKVKVGAGQPVPAERVSAPADSALWKKLFRAATKVEPFVFRDLSTRNIRSFPVAAILGYVDNLYRDIAVNSPQDLPQVSEGGGGTDGTLADLLGDLGGITGHFRLPHGPRARQRLNHDRSALDRLVGTEEWHKHGADKDDALSKVNAFAEHRRFHALDDAFAAGKVVPPGASPSSFGFATPAAMDFYQAHRFYDRPEMVQPYLKAPDATQVPPKPSPPTFDFHRILAALGDYPVLLRMLGLVVDLTLDPAGVPVGTGTLRLVPGDEPLSSFSTPHTPRTHYKRTKGRFAARPTSGSDIADGMLRLEGTNDNYDAAGLGRPFHLTQLDADGAALKLVNMASELWSVHNPDALMGASFDTPDTTGLPPLSSAGLALVRADRAARLAARLTDESGRGHNADPGAVEHFADHLLRGYRVDVHDGKSWHSLCRREGTYAIRKGPGPDVPITLPGGAPIIDEGYVKSASATSADAKDSDLYLHETLLRWDGWSLVAKRPGRTIVAKESADRLHQDEEVDWHESEQSKDVPLNTSFVPVARSLPRLRFGQSYQFRARTVDLAGNSLDPDIDDETHATEAVPYLRFEPVPPPAIVPRVEFTEGESVERLVIRSNFDQTTHEFAAAAGALLGPGHAPYAPTNDRHVVPPKTSQQMAETHGRFDEAFGGANAVARTTAFNLAAREGATLESAPGTQKINGKLPPDAPALPQGQEPPGAYFINPEAKFPLPYLPDPVAKGVAFRGLPGVVGAHIVGFEAWPDLEPFVIRIREREGTVKPGECQETFLEPDHAPDWPGDGRVLTVFLGKAEVAVVRYSCSLGELVAHMGVWQRWVAAGADRRTKRLVVEGGHWMISPFRELVLVHAVQQPLCAPAVRLISSRVAGDTFASLRGAILLSVKSTGQVDLDAAWTEPVDSLSDVKPRELAGRAHVGSLRVDSRFPEPDPWPSSSPGPDGTLPVPGAGGLPFGFPDVDQLIADDIPWEAVTKEAAEFSTPIKHEFGDTKHRWVDYRATGTTRFREYFPPEITGDPTRITRVGEQIRVNILSSARPEAPKILYTVPSFTWVTDPEVPKQWTHLRRTRSGGGLRVWMDRPWFSSGEGEKLAVVLWPDDEDPPDFYGKLVSRLGQDPAWNAAVPATSLHPNHFTNAVDVDNGLSLDESSKATSAAVKNATVTIAAFDPEYDEDRHLWFCDIDLSPRAGPAYFPFVRLALARYQRQSVDNATKLSRVIQTDFAQLLPSRTLDVTFRTADTLDITLYGPAPSALTGNRVEVTLEHHDGAIPGDLGWKPVAATPDHPNPLHLSDGMPDVSWIPPNIPKVLGVRRTDLEASNVRFRAQGRPSIARKSLPKLKAKEVASMLEIDPKLLAGVRDLPVPTLAGYVLWSGPLGLPANRKTLGPLRLVVREFEHYEADDDIGQLDTDKEDPQLSGRYLDRVVYADIVTLP